MVKAVLGFVQWDPLLAREILIPDEEPQVLVPVRAPVPVRGRAPVPVRGRAPVRARVPVRAPVRVPVRAPVRVPVRVLVEGLLILVSVKHRKPLFRSCRFRLAPCLRVPVLLDRIRY